MISPLEAMAGNALADEETRQANQGLGVASNSMFIFNPFEFTQNILDDDYKNAALEGAKMTLPMDNALGHASQLGLGAYSLFNENGLPKTYNYLKNGEYGKAALSGTGDVFNGLMTAFGGSKLAGTGLKKMSKYIINKYGITNPDWLSNAVIDGIFRPIGTYKAVRNGTYISDYSSLRRNMERVHNAMDEGAGYTTNAYNDLTGIDIPLVNGQIQSWKHFKPNTDGYYSFSTKKYYTPLTRDRYSNIALSNREAKRVSGHEQVHAAEDFLTNLFGTPSLGVYSKKTKYYIPNENNPIANKYKNYFSFALKKHGKHPEETFANYMGDKAAGHTYPYFFLDSSFRENISPLWGFIRDYKKYLNDTYNN